MTHVSAGKLLDALLECFDGIEKEVDEDVADDTHIPQHHLSKN